MALFDFILYSYITWWTILMLVLSGVHYFLGFHYIYKELFSYESQEAAQNNLSYDDTRAFFFAEYDRCNPVTQASATIDYLKYLK